MLKRGMECGGIQQIEFGKINEIYLEDFISNISIFKLAYFVL